MFASPNFLFLPIGDEKKEWILSKNLKGQIHLVLPSRSNPPIPPLLKGVGGLLFIHQVFVNRIGGLSSCAHGQDDSCRSSHDISSCPDSKLGRLSSFEVCDDITSLIQFTTRCLCRKTWMGTRTDSHHCHITFQFELRTFDG